MLKYFDENAAAKILEAFHKGDFEAARACAKAIGLESGTIVLAKDYNLALLVLKKLYNPADKGLMGKYGEVEERVTRWQENNRLYAHWQEFHARKSGRADIGNDTEMKTGCGDWLYSYYHGDRESIIEEYYHKAGKIRWATEEFIIECSWSELLDYLASYNDKGLATWFKSNVKYNPMISKTVVMMQEYKTSKKKIAYLQDCPYCE